MDSVKVREPTRQHSPKSLIQASVSLMRKRCNHDFDRFNPYRWARL